MKALLTTAQVAHEVGASAKSIRRLVRYDQVPYVRFSEKIIRFDPDSLSAIKEVLQRPRKRSLRVPLSEVEDCKVPESCPAQEDMNPNNRIYFIRSGPYVKIGFSANTQYRMTHLQIANPHSLELLFEIIGDKMIENYIHLILKDHHHRGEWFHINESVQQFMNDVASGASIDEARSRIMRASARTQTEQLTADGANTQAKGAI